MCSENVKETEVTPLEAPFFSKDLILLHIVNIHGNHGPNLNMFLFATVALVAYH